MESPCPQTGENQSRSVDTDAVIQRVRLELYRDNIEGALRLLDEAYASHADPVFRTEADRLRASLRHLESRAAYAEAYARYYRTKKGGFSFKHLDRDLRILVGRKTRKTVRRMAEDPEFRLLEREVLTIDTTRVLDAGCGEGRVALALAARHPAIRVAAIEVAATNLRLARRMNRFANAEFHHGLVEEADRLFAPGSFDLAYAFAVLEHVRDVDETVAAIIRMLRPGGRCCFVVPMSEFEVRGYLPEPARNHPDGVAGHVRVFTERSLRERFDGCDGFSLTKLPGELPASFPPTLVPREFGSYFVALTAPTTASAL